MDLMSTTQLMGNVGEFVGAIGVVGPTYLDYARIIPMVDFTAKVIGRIVG